MDSITPIAHLSQVIEKHVQAIDVDLMARGEPSPSWSLETPPVVGMGSKAIQESQIAIFEAVEELLALILGPVPWLVNKATDASSALLALHFLIRYQVPTSFPPGAKKSFASLATESSVAESDLRRFLHFNFLDRIFAIDPDDSASIIHTPVSKALHDLPQLRSCIGQLCEEVWPAASRTVDAIQKWTHTDDGNGINAKSTEPQLHLQPTVAEDQDPSHTGWNLANSTPHPLYTSLTHHPRRATQFAESMSFFHAQPGFELSHLTNGFDWAAKVGPGGLVVDIGGNQGEVSFAIAKSHPEIRFIVQDLEGAINSRNPESVLLPTSKDELEKPPHPNVKFMVHDFFSPQPVKGADVYLLRWILHNWPNAYAIKILQNLIPALKSGARILIMEHLMPEPGALGRYAERQARKVDLTMKAILNSKERTASDWSALFGRVGNDFRLVDITTPPLSELSIIEVIWEGEGKGKAKGRGGMMHELIS